MKTYRWASLGCGVIANQLAEAMNQENRSLYAIGNRTREKAVAFAEKYGVEKVYGHPEEMFTDPEVDIIYLSTPHNTHINYLLKALNNGKHVLCEKSITLNSEELTLAVDAAKANNVVLAEAMTVFHMPIYRVLKSRMDAGEFGPLRFLQLNFGSYKEWDMNNRFFSRDLAGGAMLDIGVYALSVARWFMRSQPDQVLSQVKMAPTGVDEQAGILLMNPDQEMATISLSLHSKQPKRATLSFDKCYIEIFEYPRADQATITWTEDDRKEEVAAGETANALRYEILDMEAAVRDGADMSLAHTIDVMQLMSDIRQQWGMTYPEEDAAK